MCVKPMFILLSKGFPARNEIVKGVWYRYFSYHKGLVRLSLKIDLHIILTTTELVVTTSYFFCGRKVVQVNF